MREMLFKGKTLNGEWIEGCLTWTLEKDSYFIREQKCGIDIEVIHETVGQFTGLSDKTGKRIYEGDVIAGDVPNKIVEWSNDYLGYFVGLGQGEFIQSPLYDVLFPEVIGNIHDNPELLCTQ